MENIILPMFILSAVVSGVWGYLVIKYSDFYHNADAILAPILLGLMFPPLGLYFLWRIINIVPNIIKYGKLEKPNY
jgi:hypothetical protein